MSRQPRPPCINPAPRGRPLDNRLFINGIGHAGHDNRARALGVIRPSDTKLARNGSIPPQGHSLLRHALDENLRRHLTCRPRAAAITAVTAVTAVTGRAVHRPGCCCSLFWAVSLTIEAGPIRALQTCDGYRFRRQFRLS
jgi:hypothetical protein